MIGTQVLGFLLSGGLIRWPGPVHLSTLEGISFFLSSLLLAADQAGSAVPGDSVARGSAAQAGPVPLAPGSSDCPQEASA